MKYFKTIILVAALAFLGVLLWRHYFPNEEKLIRKMISDLAEDASVSEKSKNLAKYVAADSVPGYFTPDAEIDGDAPVLGHFTFNGRQEIANAAAFAQTHFPGLKFAFYDVGVQIAPDKQSATVELTAKVTFPGQREIEMQDVRFSLSKYNGDWRIAKAETVKAFK